MFRSILRAAAGGSALHHQLHRVNPAAALQLCLNFSSKNNKSAVSKANKKAKSKDARADDASSTASDDFDSRLDEGARARALSLDENDSSLDVGPNGRPLFTSSPSLSELTRKDACTYFKFKYSSSPLLLFPSSLFTGVRRKMLHCCDFSLFYGDF